VKKPDLRGPLDLWSGRSSKVLRKAAELTLAEALQRCHMIDDHGLAWIEEPIVL
jgi:hypothetical protein